MIDQLLMRTALGDFSRFEHDDQVAIIDGAEPMGDEDGGSLLFFEDAVDV